MTERDKIEVKIEPSPKYLRLFFFVAGIVATIAYRIIFLLNPFWIEVAWYAGTIGFALYFGHRSMIEMKRVKLVREYGLIDSIKESGIPEDKKSALRYLIETSLTSKARFNSAFIFIASMIVLILNLTMDIYSLFK